MKEEGKALNRLYEERENFILIGLTGRIGSGSSQVAKILKNKSFAEVQLPPPQRDHFNNIDERKYKIIYDYLSHHWKQFQCIQISDVISSLILETNTDDFLDFLSYQLREIGGYRLHEEEYNNLKKFIDNLKREKHLWNQEDKKEIPFKEKNYSYFESYFEQLPKLTSKLKEILEKSSKTTYSKIYKLIGDNLRSSGKATEQSFNQENIFTIADTTNKIIKTIREAKKDRESTLFVIDSIRNPLEAIFFRERYSAFYLVSINTFDNNRKQRLRERYNLNDEEIELIDNLEHPKDKLKGKDIFISQNVKKCIELSDIHLNNPQNGKENIPVLKKQLAHYIALMMHPGLITPTPIERSMQIAYSAKLNSGCISRQVGAVITDQSYSIKAVGWNNTPEGQVPCLFRSVEDLLCHHDEKGFSDYELNNPKFREKISKIYPKNQVKEREKSLRGRNHSFCFKDIQNQVDGKQNQVHTRSLHAEENAFLQIVKYGGEGINGGILFSTASPCELCAKKAYQLGIKQIIYIDPYPGIATSHIFQSGSLRPKLDLFHGAIGRAYYQLYQPTLSFKDELSMLINNMD
ncbi:MAG: anti-phage dCTP deaminase [Xenococcaceae cyanobacterium MO_167.B52]|nr:anti-phage dCTP deaminase [Xenococcaceae cyanobacterium MO_167.B52]